MDRLEYQKEKSWVRNVDAYEEFCLIPVVFEHLPSEALTKILLEAFPLYSPAPLHAPLNIDSLEKIRKYLENYPEPELNNLYAPLDSESNCYSIRCLCSEGLNDIILPLIARVFANEIFKSCDLEPDKHLGPDRPLSADTPLNLIWLGSLIPDHYLENIVRIASATAKVGEKVVTNKEIVLWIDRDLLSEEDYRLMKEIPNLPIMKGVNLKVLDINDAGLESVLPCEEFSDALKWAKCELKNYAMASDILRYAILAKGADAINQAENKESIRDSNGMCYMDLDSIDSSFFDTMKKEGKNLNWINEQCQIGFINHDTDRNDFLASNQARHPILLNALKTAITETNKVENRSRLITCKKNLLSAKAESKKINKVTEQEERTGHVYITAVTQTTGPVMLSYVMGTTPLKRNSVLSFLTNRLNIVMGDNPSKNSAVNKVSDATWVKTKPDYFFQANWKDNFA